MNARSTVLPGIWPAFRVHRSDAGIEAFGYRQPIGGMHRIEAGCVILSPEEAAAVDELIAEAKLVVLAHGLPLRAEP